MVMIKTAYPLAASTVCSRHCSRPRAPPTWSSFKMAEVVRSRFYVPMYVALGKGFVERTKASRWNW